MGHSRLLIDEFKDVVADRQIEDTRASIRRRMGDQ